MSADAPIACDSLVGGASAGGCAAALAAAESGARVCLVEAGDWLGGQLTSQGVCTPDEHRWIESFGGTRRYYRFREAVRSWYRQEYALTPEAAGRADLNPGACWVSGLSYEPAVGERALRELFAPLEESGALRCFFGARLADVGFAPGCQTRIVRVDFESRTGEALSFHPEWVLDATDLGDLLPLCGAEGDTWVTGAESFAETGEPDAPESPMPHWIQPLTFPFAIEWSPETSASNLIEPPYDYELLKAEQRYHIKHGAITGLFSGRAPWWSYRRILASANFEDPRIVHDVAMINTAGNDYYGGNVIGKVSAESDETWEARAAEQLARARRVSLGYLAWLQRECPREELPDGAAVDPPGLGYPEFRLRADLFGTEDGCARAPYIRESRRIVPMRRILEQQIVVKDFGGAMFRGECARAEAMPDTLGIGHYALDIHPNGHGEPNQYVATRPFQIPLGALTPRRLENLLPACKNLGVTHLTNGAYRLHPIEWNIGESAGLLAVFCLGAGVLARDVADQPALLRELQRRILESGIPLHWLVDVGLDHPAFAAVQQMATVLGEYPSATDLLFRPDDPISEVEWRSWAAATGADPSGPLPGKRGDAAIRCMRRATHTPGP